MCKVLVSETFNKTEHGCTKPMPNVDATYLAKTEWYNSISREQ